MYETADDIRWLQALLDRSHARMGPLMRSILTPERTLTARRVVTMYAYAPDPDRFPSA